MNEPRRLPARLPLALFTVLVLATIGAFYLTQHLKVQDPLINGNPRVDPASINPRLAGVCTNLVGDRTSFKQTKIGFYLQHAADTVFVHVVNDEGLDVALMSGSGQHLPKVNIVTDKHPYTYFTWNGRLSNGQIAPAGVYTFTATLQHEGRTISLPGNVRLHVLSGRPTPKVDAMSISTSGGPASASTAGVTPSLTPGRQSATVHFRVTGHPLAAHLDIYRSRPSTARPLTRVAALAINPDHRSASWNGELAGRPAPAGSYLLGVSVTDQSCTTGRDPQVSDPAPQSTPDSGVNVSYLSATAATTPVIAGQRAAVSVADGGAAYTWTLRQGGSSHVLTHGHGQAATLTVRLPSVGLYALTLRANGHTIQVPLVASAGAAGAKAKVLVVLPDLSWQGADATDDDGDGLIDTLAAGNGEQIALQRPLVNGLPAGFADEAALLRFLDSAGLHYDLTTDVALAEGTGPTLTGRHGVLLDGTFTWLPAQLQSRLASFVSAGGGVFNDGIHSLQGTAEIGDGNHGPVAGPAKRLAVDPFGIKHGTVSPAAGQSILELTDGLGIFSTIDALQYPRYQVLTPGDGHVASAAGVASAAPSIIGIHLKAGTVVEAGLPNFGLALASDVESQELLTRVWQAVLQ